MKLVGGGSIINGAYHVLFILYQDIHGELSLTNKVPWPSCKHDTIAAICNQQRCTISATTTAATSKTPLNPSLVSGSDMVFNMVITGKFTVTMVTLHWQLLHFPLD